MANFLTNLETGIKTLFDANLSNSLTGGLWYNESKPKNSFPYCVYSFLGDKPMYWFGKDTPRDGEDILIQFTIFDKSSSAININSYTNLLLTLFDWADVSVPYYTLMEMRRDTTLPPFKVNNVWQSVITYRVKISRIILELQEIVSYTYPNTLAQAHGTLYDDGYLWVLMNGTKTLNPVKFLLII